MQKYKISVLRLGYAIVEAETEDEAREKGACLDDEMIHWLSEKDGMPGSYLVTMVRETPDSSPQASHSAEIK